MKRRGFTLLELMIATFILAMAVAVLLGTQSTSMRLMGYANNTSVVTMLTRSKMQDVEYEVMRIIKEEGVKEDYVEEMEGDFGDQGYEDITWHAKIQSIELSEDASNDFVESVTNQLYGTGDEGGTLSGNTTITQFLPMMVSFLPMIINQLGQRIRKITLTTTWDYLGVEQTLTVSQFVVALEVDAASGVSGAGVSGTTNADGTDGEEAGQVSEGETIGGSGGGRVTGTSGGGRGSGASGGRGSRPTSGTAGGRGSGSGGNRGGASAGGGGNRGGASAGGGGNRGGG
ncbi:MAG: prepilin-type N-terminal cleavage/methylation domain-containing protein, partial [Proteobacteria bacterium]|nr:prepilin-type N-terminal cleavage/methylation domain-containing protein [Pseudomonadota bacterium]